MNTTFENMTVEDLKKLRLDFFRNIFPSSVVTLFLFLIVFIQASLKNSFGLTFTFLTILTILIGTIAFHYLTRKHRIDFKEKKVLLEPKIIEDCVYKVDYEPGSATVPVNLLSLLFFKQIFMRKMKEIHIYYIVVDGERIFLEKEEFEKTEKGKQIFIRKAEQTELYLGINT
jgi:hypothetical protein